MDISPADQPRSLASPRGPVTCADLAWLAGTWIGDVAGARHTAEATYAAPRATLLAGVSQILDAGRVLSANLIAISDTPDGLEMIVRGALPGAAGCTDDTRQVLRLRSATGGHYLFESIGSACGSRPGPTAVSTYLVRLGSEEFREHTELVDERGHPAVLHVAYRRQQPWPAAQ